MKVPSLHSTVQEHFERMLRLIELERKAEIEENMRGLERFPVPTREALGKTVTRLALERADSALGGYPLVRLSRQPQGEELSPFHAMNQGDNVRLSFPAGAKPAFVDGTLERVEEYAVSLAAQGLPEPLPPGRCTLDLLGSDATYRRMKQALLAVLKADQGRICRLRDIAWAGLKPEAGPTRELDFYNPRLNKYQREAVRRALGAEDFALIHGPPGTGKTTVLVEVIRQAAAGGLRVLATAPSNIAVDNMLEKLLESPLRVVRLGHPARTLESLRHGNLQVQTAADEQFSQVTELDAWRERLVKKLSRSGRRALTWEERRRAEREIDALWKQARKLELAISRRIALSAQVVLTTHGGLSRSFLRGEFDLVALDEASQATEPLSWIALLEGKKAVFAGDSMQLPPTLYSKETAKELGFTLFERLQAVLPESMQSLLRVQYRMHEAIMGYSSRKFYQGKLIADESVRRHLARGLPGVKDTELTSAPLVFVDTAGAGYEEVFDELLQSRQNQGEAELARKLLQELLEAGLKPNDVAVLTPYVAQVKLLKSAIRAPGVEIGTVDGFQGREKEATVLSLVRSNDSGEVGFLADTRRMNVAITRARRLLVVIGDSATVSHHPFYRDFIDYAQGHGRHLSAWDWAKP